jgi:ribosomal protein S18 acetylase RimI-like enzyme
VIRDGAPEDRDAVEPLWAECLRLHGIVPEPWVFARTWAFALSGQGFGLRVAEGASGLAGFAFHSWQFNSWTGGTDGSLDTLFVAEAARGTGLGRALLDDLLALGRVRGWRTIFWHVAADNAPARALYERLAEPDSYLRYRITL